MKTRILLSVMVIALTAILIGGASTAYFYDVETNYGNTFTAGKLDLQIDDGDVNVVKFNSTNMKPGSQPTAKYKFSNIGTIPGYLNITKAIVTDFENDWTEPEIEAGDTTPDMGELSQFLNLRLYLDNDGDGYISTGDEMIFNGRLCDLPDRLIFNKLIPAGGTVYILSNAIIDWWSTDNDNVAQSDSCTFDLEFTLSQVKANASLD